MDLTVPLAVVGALLIAIGAALVYLPAGIILAGIACVAATFVARVKVER